MSAIPMIRNDEKILINNYIKDMGWEQIIV